MIAQENNSPVGLLDVLAAQIPQSHEETGPQEMTNPSRPGSGLRGPHTGDNLRSPPNTAGAEGSGR